MEILIIVPRYDLTLKKNYNYTFPLGLAYISSALKGANYPVKCLNLNHLDGKIPILVNEELDKKKYDIVCSGGNALMYDTIKLIVDTISQHPTKPQIILGGPIITSEPELMIKNIKPHFGVIGEGEETIIELLKTIKDKGDLSKVDGIIYQNKNEEIASTKPRLPIKDIETLPRPDYDGIGLNEKLKYSRGDMGIQDYPRTYYILGSRGCPFNCSFCWHGVKYRARSVKNILDELEANIKKYKINDVYLLDDCFSANPQRVYDFCKGIKKISEEVGWPIYWFCSLMVTSVNKELLDTMEDAGCSGISYGFESYSPIVLKSMRKPITPQQIDNALNLTLDAKISVIAGFILGDVAETKETAKETINYWKNHCNGQTILGFIKPYPGSDIYRHCIENGIIKDKLSYIQNEMVSKKVVKMTKNFTGKEFKELIEKTIVLSGTNYYFSKIISIKKTKPDSQIYSITIKCPFCNEISTYKNCQIGNKWAFRLGGNCRNCRKFFLTVSPIQRIAYRNYPLARAIWNYYSKLKRVFIIKMQ